MPIWLQPWEFMHAGGQFEGRQPGSCCAVGAWTQSDTVGGRGPVGGRLQAENPRPPTSRTSGDRRQHTSAVPPTSSFGPISNKQLKQRRGGLELCIAGCLLLGERVTTRRDDAVADGGAEPCPLEVQLAGTVLEVGGLWVDKVPAADHRWH